MIDVDNLPDIDKYTLGPIVEPYNDDIKVDYLGFRNYIEQKHNGDSSLMTQEEKDMFITRVQHRKTA